MIKYSIITCLFGYYDTLKEPEEVDFNAEYLCITNRTDLQSNVWKFIYDEELNDYELGIQKSFVVKYKKLFTYINPDSKYIIRLDASIQIHKSLYNIIKYLNDNNYDCCLMLHPERNDMISEYNEWESLRNHNKKYKDIFLREMFNQQFNINNTGLIETTFQIYKINENIKNLINDISNIIQKTTNFCDNNDQCYFTYCLSKYINIINPLFVNRQIISSDYMDLCFHYSNEIVYKDHIHAKGPLGENIYDLNKPLTYKLFNKEYQIKYFTNKTTSAIIVQIKNENKYLDEWILHNQKIGINHIYLIDNNDINGEDPHNIINKYENYITYINCRGNNEKNIQQKNYVTVYNKYSSNYNWFLFIDPDEFITLVEDNNINDYLSREIFDKVHQIFINWLIYDDNDLIYYENKPVQERFTRIMNYNNDKSEYPIYNLHKPFLRGGLHINNANDHKFHNIINYENEFISVNDIGEYISQENGSNEHNETLCYIKHYMTKSLEEFINKKFNKDDGNHMYKYDFESGYFNINNHTIEKDNYIKQYLNLQDNELIGIFYIATGIYKQFFNKFLETIHYCFPNKIKKLIIISDGLKEYNNMYINGVHIIVEDFINYAYPFINIHKFNIIEHYALKHNINNIVYFDAETCFFEKDIKFYDDLLEQSKDKLISLIPLYFYGITMREHIISSNIYSLTAQTEGFDDFSFFYKSYDYDTCDPNYKWIQTSFFICTLDYLKKLNVLMNNLITYNSRIMGCKLCFSDEFYINYLNIYYPELFHADYYAYNGNDDIRLDSMFFRQKYVCPIDKQKVKFGNSNFNFRMIMFNIDSDDDINKFFIKHINNFLLYSCNSHTINDKIFYSQINLNNEWFDNEHNIILERTFYTNNFIRLYEENEKIYIGFINKINEFSNSFDYDDFYNNDYDYIKGYSFDNIKNMKFKDIDMCCFSKRYIEAYFNNDDTFKPKIYEI